MSDDRDRQVLNTARAILCEGTICDHCLGRQFAKLSTGTTNLERGRAIRLVLDMIADASTEDASAGTDRDTAEPEQAISGRCWVCNGVFEELGTWTSRAIEALDGCEYETFLVGTR